MNYQKDLDEIDSRIEAMAGYEWQHFHITSSAVEWDRNDSEIENSKDATENYLVSFFGRLNYTFKDRYLLTATVRQDGSSRFHKDNRWGTFPSFAFAWRMKEEGFMQNMKELTNLKLRLGYGVTGQQELNSGDYPYFRITSYNVCYTKLLRGRQSSFKPSSQQCSAHIQYTRKIVNLGLR